MEELLGTLYLGKRFERPTATPLLLSRPTQQLPLLDQPSFLSHSHGSVQLAESASAIIVSPDSQELVTGAAAMAPATTQRSPDRVETTAITGGATSVARHSHSPSPHRRSSALPGGAVGGESAAGYTATATTVSPMRDTASPFVAAVPALALQRSTRTVGTTMSGGGNNGALTMTATTNTVVAATDTLQKSLHERPMRVPVRALEGRYVLLLLSDPRTPATWTSSLASNEAHGEEWAETRGTEGRPGQSLSLPASRLEQHLSPYQSPPLPHETANLSEPHRRTQAAALTTTTSVTGTATSMWPHTPLQVSSNELLAGRATVALSPSALTLFSSEATGPRATPYERPPAATQSLSTVLLPPITRPGTVATRRLRSVERELLAFYCLLLRHLQGARRSPGLDDDGGATAEDDATSELAGAVSAPVAVLEVRYTSTVHSLGPAPSSLPPSTTNAHVSSSLSSSAATRGSGGGSYHGNAPNATSAAAATTASAPLAATTTTAASVTVHDAPSKDTEVVATAGADGTGVAAMPNNNAGTVNNAGGSSSSATMTNEAVLLAACTQTERRDRERLEGSAKEQSSHPLFYSRGSVDSENCATTLRRLLASDCDEGIALDTFYFDEELQSSPHYGGWFYIESGEAYRRLLRHFAVREWPALLLLDPNGRVVTQDALARLEAELTQCATQLVQQRAALLSSPRHEQQASSLPTTSAGVAASVTAIVLGQSVPQDGLPLAMTRDSNTLTDMPLAVSGAAAANELSAQLTSDVFGAGGLHLSTLLNSQSFGTNTNTSSSLAGPEQTQASGGPFPARQHTAALEPQPQEEAAAVQAQEGEVGRQGDVERTHAAAEAATARPSDLSPTAVGGVHATDSATDPTHREPRTPSTPTEAAGEVRRGGAYTAVTTPSTADPTPVKNMPTTARYVEPQPTCSPQVSYRTNNDSSGSSSPAADVVGGGQIEEVAATATEQDEVHEATGGAAASASHNAAAAAPTSVSPSPSLRRRSRTGSTTDSTLQAHYRFPPWSGPRWAYSEPGEEEEEDEVVGVEVDDADEVDGGDVDAAVTALTLAGPRPGTMGRLRRPSHTPQPGTMGDNSSVFSQPASLSLGRQGSGQAPLFGLRPSRLLNAAHEEAIAATAQTTATAWLHSVPFVSAFPWSTPSALAELDSRGDAAPPANAEWVRSVSTVRHAIKCLAAPDTRAARQPSDASREVSTEAAHPDADDDAQCVEELLQRATVLVLFFGAAWHPAMPRTLQLLQQVLKTASHDVMRDDDAGRELQTHVNSHVSSAQNLLNDTGEGGSNDDGGTKAGHAPRWSIHRVMPEDDTSCAAAVGPTRQDAKSSAVVLFVSADSSEKDLRALLCAMPPSWLCVSPLLWRRQDDAPRAALADQFLHRTMREYAVDRLPRLVVHRRLDAAEGTGTAPEVRCGGGAWGVVERHAERQLYSAASSTQTLAGLQRDSGATELTRKASNADCSDDDSEGCSDEAPSSLRLFAVPPMTTSLGSFSKGRTSGVALRRPDALPLLLEAGGYFVVLCALGAVDARLHAQCARALGLAAAQIMRDLRQLKEQAMEGAVGNVNNNNNSSTTVHLERPSQPVAATAVPPPSTASALGLSTASAIPSTETNLTRWLAGLMTCNGGSSSNPHSSLNAHAYYYISHPPAPGSGSSPGSPLRPARPSATTTTTTTTNKDEGNTAAATQTSAQAATTATTTTVLAATAAQIASGSATTSALRGPLSAHEYPLHSHSPLMTHANGGGSLAATTVAELGNTISPCTSNALSGFGRLPAVHFFDAVYRDVTGDEDEAKEPKDDTAQVAPSFSLFAAQATHQAQRDVGLTTVAAHVVADKENEEGAELPVAQPAATDTHGEKTSQHAQSASSSFSSTPRLDQTEEACARYRDSLALLQEYIFAPIIDQDERQLPPREGELFLACVRLPQRTTSVLRRRLQSDVVAATTATATAGLGGGTSANTSATTSATMPPSASSSNSAAATTAAAGGGGGAVGHVEGGGSARLPPVAPSSVSNEPGSFPSVTNSFSNTATTSSNMEGSLKDTTTTTAPSEPDPMPLTSPDVIWQFVWEQLWCAADG